MINELKSIKKSIVWLLTIPIQVFALIYFKVFLVILIHGTGSGLGDKEKELNKIFIFHHLPVILPILALIGWYTLKKDENNNWLSIVGTLSLTVFVYVIMYKSGLK